ncbi:MFS transporter [Saccharopolyspora rhizosphaerae]|uniref:MFS transporter n=2 Tax=Saccharopolyspora rhizosphaerae TaxID=2492662 RepID=A0A3R8P2U3_9PSEU|nr:MFS transporter [Saccharopolyspora rhizosphaerae]
MGADFRRFWVADGLSQIGSRISFVALPLLAITELGASPFQVSLLAVLETAAFLVLGLPVGAWCDGWRNRPVLVVADLGRALALISLPVAAWSGRLALWQLYAVVAVVGVLTVFFDVAHQSYLPRLVDRSHLVEGNSKLQANTSVAEVSGPAAGGLLVQWLSAPLAIVVDAVSFLWSAGWLRAIRSDEPPRERPTDRRLTTEIREGLQFVFGHPVLRAIACSGASVVFFQAASIAIVIAFLALEVGLSPGEVGVLSSIGPLGAVAAALSTGAIARRVGQARLMLVAIVGLGAGMLLVPLTGPGPRLAWFAIGGVISGFCLITVNIVEASFRQALCPDHLMGRMNATMRFMLRATAPFGALLGGVIGTHLGMRTTLWIAALGVLLSSAWLLTSPLRHTRDLPVDDSSAVPAVPPAEGRSR